VLTPDSHGTGALAIWHKLPDGQTKANQKLIPKKFSVKERISRGTNACRGLQAALSQKIK
jgi:hypothetical protein